MLKVTTESYNKLSEKSRVGIKQPEYIETTEAGPNLPVCLKGSLQTKNKTLFKPKIPKSGKSLYKGYYIRPNSGFNLVYDVESTVFIVALHSQDPKEWIDKNEIEIKKRLKEIL